MKRVLNTSRNLVLLIVFAVAAGSSSFAQFQGTDIEQVRERIQGSIQEYNPIISVWHLKEQLQNAFVLAVICFGGLITIFQGVNKGWSKPATLILGACTSIVTGINTKFFPADYHAAVRDGKYLVADLELLYGQPQADLLFLQKQWSDKQSQFRNLQKAVEVRTVAFNVWERTVFAQSNAPEWIAHPPSDPYNLYFIGIAEDGSISTASQQSRDNAVVAATTQLSGQANCEPLRRLIANSAATDKSYFEFDKDRGVYRFYTLLRMGIDIKKLRVSCTGP